ncbi:MAG: nickel-dependent hydrogenase large subunit [Leptospirales bacterium]|nr:nickel-dependent hydrogenase large subunit [Leptospirales bacterium]
MAKVFIDPLTRIEGHLSLELDVQNGRVVDAKSIGDMYRGLETILIGRNPVDANQIMQRICGVCPVSQGLAASKCLDDAFGIKPNKNGRLLRNLVLAANYIQSHLIHFYHLSALDFVDIKAILEYKGNDSKLLRVKEWAKNDIETKQGRDDELTQVGPFLPRYEGKGFYIDDVDTNIDAIAGYLKALDIRIKCHQMVATFGGRVPHLIGLVPGGVTQIPTNDKIKQYRKLLKEVERFVNNEYTNHIIAVAKAFPDYFKIGHYSNFLSYGFDEPVNDERFFIEQGVVFGGGQKVEVFDANQIREQVRFAHYKSGTNLHPYRGETDPQPGKQGSYTWLKAPRYNDAPMEVGPLARVAVAYLSGNNIIKEEVDKVLKIFNADLPAAFSVLGRHASRLIECKIMAKAAYEWLSELEKGGRPRSTYEIPDTGQGEGLVEAPRGALGHWIVIKDKKIANYQAVVPSTWYCGPRDDKGNLGPVEQMLIGTPIADPRNPIEAARVVRSTDPCIACAIHVVEGDKEIGTFRIC